MTAPCDVAGPESRAIRALAGAVAGVLAAAVALGVAQFASGVGVPQSSPVLAVGQAAIDLPPPQVKDFAISAFGTNDKTALLDGIVVILALYAAAVGMLAVRRLAFGMCGLAIFAFIGLWAALTRPNATADYAVPTLAGAAAGAFALTWLARAARLLRSPAARWLPPTFPLPRTRRPRSRNLHSAPARPTSRRMIRTTAGHPGGRRGGGS